MDDKPSIFQGVQLGIETTPGVAVPANVKLPGVSMTPKPHTESDAHRALGEKYAKATSLNKEYSTLDISGKPSFNELTYLFASLLHYSAPVQQGSTIAYKWTFTSNTSAEDVGKYFTIEQGDVKSAWRVDGVRVSGLTLNLNRNAITVSGEGIGGKFEPSITLTANPTTFDPIPILPSQLKFFMADTLAELASVAALTRAFAMEWSLTGKFGLAWPVGQDPFVVEKEPSYKGKVKVATNAEGMAIINDMRASATKWFKIEAIGGTIADSYKNTLSIVFPAKIDTTGDIADHEGVYAIEYGLQPIHDATWGKAMQIELINNLKQL